VLYLTQDMILKIDLNRNKIVKSETPHDLKSAFIGGRGVNVKTLFDEVPPHTDAFSPRNVLIFGVGPLVGMGPGTGRINVTAKSPLTILGDSNAGGDWAPELRFAGYNYIMFVGRASTPVYLNIQDNDVQIKEAGNLWGLETWETEQRLKEQGEDVGIKVASIGPAGENLVRFACVKFGHRTAARCGLGAVMGSKNLKAIAVKGTNRKLEPSDSKTFSIAVREVVEKIDSTGLKLGIGGPGGGTYGILWSVHNEACMMFTRHMQSGYWEKASKLSPELFYERFKITRIGCYACPVRCTPYYEVPDGKCKGVLTKVEYGQIAPFSAAVDVADLSIALKAVEMADRLGVDAKSCGCSISFAMELFERGIIDENDVGFNLNWGDGAAMLRLIEMIATRRGFGNVLAEGEHRAASIIGKGAEKFDITVKGMEPHEPLRAQVGNALAQYVSSRGPDHLRGGCHVERDMSAEEAKRFLGYEDLVDSYSYEHKPNAVIFYEHIAALADMIGVCKFFTQWTSMHGIDADLIGRLVSAATGINMNSKDVLKAAERVVNVERAFLGREGVSRKDDYPPGREFEEPFSDGRHKGAKLDKKKYNLMLTKYYRLRGWNIKNGMPKKSKLRELGLNGSTSLLKNLANST